MAMDRIQGPPLTRQGALENFRNTQQTEGRTQSDASGSAGAATEKGSNAPHSDQAVISEAGKQLVDLRKAVDTGRAALEALPDVRQDKVDLARQRMAQGFYKSAAVRDQVAQRLTGVLAAMDKDNP